MIITDKEPERNPQKKTSNYTETISFFNVTGSPRDYSNIAEFLEITYLIVNKLEDGKKLQEYIYEVTQINVSYYLSEKEANKTDAIFVILDHDTDKDTYEFKLKEKNKEYDYYSFFPFDEYDISSEDAIDLFRYSEYYLEDSLMYYLEYQSLLARFLIKQKTNKYPNKDINFIFGVNSFPPYDFYSDSSEISIYFGFSISIEFILMFYIFNLSMIDEKEKRLSHFLERQGISKSKYYISWLYTYLVIASYPTIIFILVSIAFIGAHIYLVLISLLLLNLAIFSMMCLFTTLISNLKAGSTILKFFLFGTTILSIAVSLKETPKYTKIIFSLFPVVNQLLSIISVGSLAGFRNISWDILWLKVNKISYMETIIIYILDIVLYSTISTFIESYKRSGLNFLQFLKSIFVKVGRNKVPNEKMNEEYENFISNDNINHQELTEINKKYKSENNYLSIQNVTRTYGDLKAVNNLNCELFPNEIFCLLGHNGAGKTTLIKMISGIEDPDLGDIIFNGVSLVTNKKFLYQNLGLCEQEDCFFGHLSVQEHLKYMCEIKGSQVNESQIIDLIKRIDLVEKQNSPCDTLSGGQKRKLCIALALIGNSKIILLDEPTSGMDVIAKRALWDFLKNYKNNKIIVLTTHSLDEAEYLGDRIGIMSDGRYLCSGTSSYLKEKYPCGFNLNFLLDSSKFNDIYKNDLLENIRVNEPNLEIKIDSKSNLSINIQSNNQNIPQIFQIIEKLKANYGIEDYTVSSTTLEDVFLKLNNKEEMFDRVPTLTPDQNTVQVQEEKAPVVSPIKQLFSQIKRTLFPLWRNKSVFILELISALGFVYIFIFLLNDIIFKVSSREIDLIEILEANENYIYEKNEEDIKKSYIYEEMSNFITLKKVNNLGKIEEFIERLYENSLAHIAKGGIGIKPNDLSKDIFDVYNTEIPTSTNGYYYANIMLVVSTFLKKEYGINAAILTSIEYVDSSIYSQEDFDLNELSILFTTCFISGFGLIAFLGGLIGEKIKERINNIKHLLYLSGSNMFSYWSAFFLVDYLKLMIFTALLMSAMYYVSNAAKYLWINMVFVCLASIPFIYFVSFLCSKEDSGQKALYIIIIGFILSTLLIFICLISAEVEIDFTPFISVYNFTIFDITPLTSMLLSFIRILVGYTIFNVLEEYTEEDIDFPDEIGGIYRPMIYVKSSILVQSINFIFYTILLVIAEKGYLAKILNYIKVNYLVGEYDFIFSQEQASEDFVSNNNVLNPSLNNYQPQVPNIQNNIQNVNNNIIEENNNNQYNIPLVPQQNRELLNSERNPYVQNEINKVNNNHDLTTKIVNLRKTFYFCCQKNVRAVNNLYLGLEQNQKFGLLGFNGSGKTTIFKSITNEILFDSGEITLFGKNNQKKFNDIRTVIGYCPQSNPLFEFMKVKEILKFYSELKVYNYSVRYVSEKFGLEKYLDTYCKNLSGGNKRKLTFAIALMNNPQILLLDEPSTGVDPESRRIMWKNINALSNSDHQYNMILTTHSMEEAEILCDTVSWLKKGNFVCIGNPEKLKIQFSAGYKLHIKFKKLEQNIDTSSSLDIFNEAIKLIIHIDKYSDFILNSPSFLPYILELVNIVKQIKDKTKSITLDEIRKDLSFELVVHVNKEAQSQFFSDILNMKNVNDNLSEISINMQSLENIFTSF